MTSKQKIIETLGLAKHKEGGYFVRTYESDMALNYNESERISLSSIFYLLTDESPVGYLHKNLSDIIHFYHHGGAIKYIILHPGGRLEETIMGDNLEQGQVLQLVVKGGCWKASQLLEGEYGLISEAVTPGFEYQDHVMADTGVLENLSPDITECLKNYIKP